MWLSIVFWIIVAIATLVLDVITSSLLFSWFSVGAIGAIITLTIGGTFTTQAIIFMLVSIVCMVGAYPLTKKFSSLKNRTDNSEEKGYIGEKFIAEEEIKDTSIIKFKGNFWTVKNYGETIKKGENVEIKDIQGNKLIIEKYNKNMEE